MLLQVLGNIKKKKDFSFTEKRKGTVTKTGSCQEEGCRRTSVPDLQDCD